MAYREDKTWAGGPEDGRLPILVQANEVDLYHDRM